MRILKLKSVQFEFLIENKISWKFCLALIKKMAAIVVKS